LPVAMLDRPANDRGLQVCAVRRVVNQKTDGAASEIKGSTMGNG
jgi:hypothetical protein